MNLTGYALGYASRSDVKMEKVLSIFITDDASRCDRDGNLLERSLSTFPRLLPVFVFFLWPACSASEWWMVYIRFKGSKKLMDIEF